MRYFLEFAYRGTDFHGSQSQPNALTVQETMEGALSTILRREVPLTFAGRTDAGVHARMMVAHADIEGDVPENLFFGLTVSCPNQLLSVLSDRCRRMPMPVLMPLFARTGIMLQQSSNLLLLRSEHAWHPDWILRR